MNSRRFLILTVIGFVTFVTALAVYMSTDDPPRPPPEERKSVFAELSPEEADKAGISMREHFTKLRKAREDATAEAQRLAAQPKPQRHSKSRHWRERIGQLAEQIDEAAVRVRSNVAEKPVAKLAAGAAEMQSGRPDAAIDQFDQILAKRPKDTAALSGKAAALIRLRRFAEAEKVYTELARLAPRDATTRYNYGVLLYRLGRFGEAAEQFRDLVAIDPAHARGQYNLATLAQRAGHLEEAREAWEAFTRLEPKAANGWFNLGVVWMDFNRPLEAVSCFAEVVEITPEDADAWLNLGLAYAAAGHVEPAFEAVSKADAAAPCDPTIMRCLADLHDILANQGGPGADEHRRKAAGLRERLDEPGDDAPPALAGSSESEDSSSQ